MSKVIPGYFEDAHRGLQRQQADVARGLGPTNLNVQLPPLRPDSGPAALGGGMESQTGSWEKGGPVLQGSQSMGSLDFSREQVTRGLQDASYQQALSDNSKLARKVRQLQDQLAITSAKKDAFMAQAQRLEREFKKGREQSDTLQRELLEAKREAGNYGKEAQEAVQMMNEMRKAHIHEVRMLQRGLAARGADPSMRNRVNDVADLVDKVGRAVVQRDEAIRDKQKMQAQLNKATSDLRGVSEDASKLKRQNKQLQAKLKEAIRKGKFQPKKSEVEAPDDSDEEFESELSMFEKRFQILEEGPAGLDILASNLSKDKANLEKKLKASNENVRMLTKTVEDWKRVCADKDEQISDLNDKLEQLMKNQARLEEQIEAKKREIELAVQAERERLEARIAELEMENDDARELADGMEKASSALTRELVKVHETYARPVPGAAGGPGGAGAKGERIRSVEQQSKTGERMKLEIFKKGEVTELHAKEAPDGEECNVTLTPELVKELQEQDKDDPWTELFRRVGVDPGPPRRIVVATLIGQKEVSLPPSKTSVLLNVYKFNASRYVVSGVILSDGTTTELAILEDAVTPPLKARIATCKDDKSIFSVISAGLTFQAKELGFNAVAASKAR